MTRLHMPIRWNSIPNDSWETTLNQTLVGRSLAMAGGSVSITISLLLCQMEGTAGLIYRSFFFFFFVGTGLNIAQKSLWIACAMSLAVFDIEKSVDTSGNVIEPAEIRYSTGAVR